MEFESSLSAALSIEVVHCSQAATFKPGFSVARAELTAARFVVVSATSTLSRMCTENDRLEPLLGELSS